MSNSINFTPQMSLGLSVNNNQQFESFYTANSAKLLVSTFKQLIDQNLDDFIFLSGSKGSGKTHLLLSALHYAQHQQLDCAYLPLEDFIDFPAKDVIENYSNVKLLLIDDIEACAIHPEWQTALFDLYNNRLNVGLATIFSASHTARNLDCIELNDLKSRLAACLSFHIPVLNDTELEQFLQFIAEQRGIVLTEQCLQFILLRAGRSLNSLLNVINKLDAAQLSAGRKITVPFIKSLFEW